MTVSKTTDFSAYKPDLKIDWVGSKNNYDLVSKQIASTDGGTVNQQIGDAPVPEPVSMAVLGVGMAGLGYIRMRRRTSAVAAA